MLGLVLYVLRDELLNVVEGAGQGAEKACRYQSPLPVTPHPVLPPCRLNPEPQTWLGVNTMRSLVACDEQ